jgi:hypothetical protein
MANSEISRPADEGVEQSHALPLDRPDADRAADRPVLIPGDLVGRLAFKDGVPTAETARKVYDTLDFTRALNVYNNSFRGGLGAGDQEEHGAHRRRQ